MAENTEEFDSSIQSYNSLPSYLVAADNHAVAAGETSILDYIKGAGGAVVGGVIGQALIPIPVVGAAVGAAIGGLTTATDGKWAEATLVNGANSFYNSGVAIANWFGADAEKADMQEWMDSVDSDLGGYYQKHKELVDASGFIAGSFIPGTAALKAYKMLSPTVRTLAATEAGFVGANMSEATGLLAPLQQRALTAAMSEITSANATFSLINRNALIATAAGFGEQAIQSAVMETAIAATMFESPVLEAMDVGDLASNIMWGTLFGGAIGGGIETALSYGKIKTAKIAADADLMPYQHITAPRPNSSLDEKLLIAIDDKVHTPPKDNPELIAKYGENTLAHKRDSKIETINNSLISNINAHTGGDTEIGNIFASEVLMFDDIAKSSDKLLGLREVSRIAGKTAADKELNIIAKKMASGTASPEDITKFESHTETYLQVFGERAGEVFSEAPIYAGIQDTLKAGEKLTVTDSYVQIGSQNRIKFQYGAKAPAWDIMTASQEAIEARYLFAYNLKRFDHKLPINSTDIPFLERGIKEMADGKAPSITVRFAEDNFSKTFTSSDELTSFVMNHKDDLTYRMKTATQDLQIISDPILAEKKLKELTGVHLKTGESDTALAWTYKGTSAAREDIFVNSKALTNTPLARLVQAVKHEEGHNAWNLITDIGMVGKQDLAKVLAEAEPLSRQLRPTHWSQADFTKSYDYLRDPHELMADMFSYASSRSRAELQKVAPKFTELLYAHVNPIPQEIVDALSLQAKKLTNAEISRRLNMRVNFLDGKKASDVPTKDYFANQAALDEYAKRRLAAGIRPPEDMNELLLKPQHVKLVYDKSAYKDIDGNTLDAIAAIKVRQRLYQEGNDRVVTSVLGQEAGKLFAMPEDVILKTNSFGAGAGKITAADGSYGAPGAFMERIGKVTHDIMIAKVNTVVEALTPSLHKIRSNLADTLELSTTLNKVRATPEQYVLNEAGDALILKGIRDIELRRAAAKTQQELDKLKPYDKIDAEAADSIPLKSEAVRQFVADHISINGSNVSGFNAIKSQKGLSGDIPTDTFYAPPADPESYAHFAFVVDNSLTGALSKPKMIHAASEEMLADLASKVPKKYKVVFKRNSEEYHKAIGDYKDEAAMLDTRMNTDLHRAGVSSPFFPTTDGTKLVDDLLSWHSKKARQLVRESVLLKYSKETEELRRLGDSYTSIATSKYGRLSTLKIAEDTVKNPYVDYIKTMLDIGKGSDWRLWTDINTKADMAVSKVWNTVTGAFVKTKSVEELELVNTALKEAGINTAYYNAATDLLANHSAPRHALSTFVQRGNAILASITLRPDVLNAVNNTIGSIVLTATEMQSVLGAIKAGNAQAVGDLAALAHIKVPGADKQMFSSYKLVHNAIKNFSDPLLRETARRDGYISRHLMEYSSIADDLALTGSESVAQLDGIITNTYNKAMKYADVAEKYTGNKTAEEFTRFVAADIMRQVTDVAIKHGVLDKQLASSYIQKFVNRTQGNYLASQRPLLFQGPVGQAIGLFQTYQTTLMQQLFRHVSEGNGKNAAMLLGLQGTIYGMNGLPAFQAVNTHLIGNAAGNPTHSDIYSTVYNGINKDAADWLTYGLASNMLSPISQDLKFNLYTRGDINPRHLTIVPTNLVDIPIVSASTKFFGNIFNMLSNVANHGDISNVLLQGLEHNGVSRPLAGLAQVLEAAGNSDGRVYSTDNHGNISASNDLLSLVNFGRILGGKPMDEAIAIDAGFRKTVYQASDAARKKELGAVIKTSLIAGETPSPYQLEQFMQEYVNAGGKQEGFNKYMVSLSKRANTSQSNIIAQNLKTPYGKRMQELLGGSEVRDFTNTPIDAGTTQE